MINFRTTDDISHCFQKVDIERYSNQSNLTEFGLRQCDQFFSEVKFVTNQNEFDEFQRNELNSFDSKTCNGSTEVILLNHIELGPEM